MKEKRAIDTVGIYLTEQERVHINNVINDLEAKEEAALRAMEGPEAETYAAERAALFKLSRLPIAEIRRNLPSVSVGPLLRVEVERVPGTDDAEVDVCMEMDSGDPMCPACEREMARVGSKLRKTVVR